MSSKTYYWIRCNKEWETIAEGKYNWFTRSWRSLFKGEKFIRVAQWRG
jgi:hypothetical protein